MYFDLNTFLFIATIFCVVVALIDKCFFKSARLQNAVVMQKQNNLSEHEFEKLQKAPFFADYAHSLWFVLLIVFILRGVFFGNMMIPTGSLLPTIQLGDYVFVNQTAYGIHIPLTSITFAERAANRGDIAVLKYPVNPQVDFIKRVIGLPGDHISMKNKVLYINGKEMKQTFVKSMIEPADSISQTVNVMQEDLDGVTHEILIQPWTPPVNFTDLVVPKGEYFVMGDNRDASEDSRYWGFVPQNNLVGRAFIIWFSFDRSNFHVRWNRIGMSL